MSDISQKPTQETTMDTSAKDNRFSGQVAAGPCGGGQTSAARLHAIHDLIRSGDYHVPATAIADRMIERMIADRRRRAY